MFRWQRWLAYLPALSWYAFIYWLSSHPKLPGPEDKLLEFVWFKTAHAIFYAILAVLTLFGTLMVFGQPKNKSEKILFLGVFLVVAALAVFDELHQAFVPGRHPMARDVVIDSLAAAAVLLGFSRYNWGRRKFLLPGM